MYGLCFMLCILKESITQLGHLLNNKKNTTRIPLEAPPGSCVLKIEHFVACLTMNAPLGSACAVFVS